MDTPKRRSKNKNDDEVEVELVNSKIKVYPKQLPQLNPEPYGKQNILTEKEKLVLIQTWRLIKPQMRRIGRQISHQFFTDHPEQINRFRGTDSDIDLALFHGHSMKIMIGFGSVIERGLKNQHELSQLITTTIELHRRHGVTHLHVFELMIVFIKGIIDEIKDKYSQSVSVAFAKLCKYVEILASDFDSRNASLVAMAVQNNNEING